MQQTDLPRFDDSPANWAGPELAKTPERWIHELSAEELADIERVVARHGGRADDLTCLRLADCEMPVLAPRLKRIRKELLDGCGVSLIRGLASDAMTLREAATAF
ncbi:MAG: hypothetical protein R3D67_19340 [Hyphomicrobiaceae bacterium]